MEFRSENLENTSLLAFIELQNKGVIETRKKMIIDVLKKHNNLSDFEIAKILGFNERNSIAPRRRELEKQGLIYCVGKRKCSITNKLVKIWCVK